MWSKLHNVTPGLYKKTFPKAAACKFSTKVGLLKHFAKFTGKHLCSSLFLNINKFANKVCNFITKKLRRRCFPKSFTKFLRSIFVKYLQTDAFRNAIMWGFNPI